MKTLFSTVLILFSIGLQGQLDWLTITSTPDIGTSEYFYGACAGPGGEVYAAGLTNTLTFFQPYLQRLTSAGNPVYTQKLGTGRGVAYDVAFDDSNGRLIVGGTESGRPFLRLIDPLTGSTLSTAPMSGGGTIKGIDVTGTNIYAIGNYTGTLAFGTALSITGGGAFVAQFDLNGNIIRAINVRGAAKGFDIKASTAGDIYFTLTTDADIPFGTGFPGNYTYSGSGEDQVMVMANSSMQAQWSTLMRNSNIVLSAESELPVALDEASGIVYGANPYEPSTTPTVHGQIGSYQMLTGSLNQSVTVAGRTVRDLTVNCDELFATGGTVQSFGRTTCGDANHVAWYESYGNTLTGSGQSSATVCSYGEAISIDNFGNLVLAGGFQEAPGLTWDAITEPSSGRSGAMVAHLPTNQQCCTQSTERCLRFDGFQDNVSFAGSPLQGRSAFTIETWFRNEDTSVPPAGPGFFKHLFSNNGNGFGVGVRGGNLSVRAGSGAVNQVLALQNNRWYHLAVTYENNTLTTYLDCQRVDRRPANLTLFNDFRIGQNGGVGSLENWEGRMDEFSIYDYARGPGEIMAQKDCRRSGSEDGLLLYLPLDQGLPGQANPTETIAFDLSPSANNGTLGGFTLNGQQSNWVCSPIILSPPCPPPPCGQPLPNNTFSLYQETRDVGTAAGTPKLDVAYGAFRLPSGDIIFGGVVDGTDDHSPIYFAKTDDQGNLIGNPDLYHPASGKESIALLREELTPVRDATGNITGFLSSQLHESAPGQAEQRVLLRLDLNLNLVSSRVYQSLLPGVSERFTDIIQDSNGDFIAIGSISRLPYNAGFAMKIRPDLSIAAYELIQDFSQEIFLDKIIEGAIGVTGPTGGVSSHYIIGGHTFGGDLFFEGLDFFLKPVSGLRYQGAGEPSTGSGENYLAGMALRSDGALALVGSSKGGNVWVSLFPSPLNQFPSTSYLIDIDGGKEEAYSVHLRSGDRLLIGGRAETSPSAPTRNSRASLLEFDLQTATVNWVRTYGNAAYPESVVVSVYADNDGIILSGYGVTAAGVAVGGLSSLNHLDSWMAATDSLGRVFDCDCYQDSYATVSTVSNTYLGVLPEYISVNKGQDDLSQDRTKASVLNYFCDQYNSTMTPIACGGEDRDRMQLVIDTEILEDGNDWTVVNSDLPDCFNLIIDWGDGTSGQFRARDLPARHTYAEDGDYRICLLFQAMNEDGAVFWEEERCDAITRTDDRLPAVALTVYPNPTSGLLHLRYPNEYGAPAATVFSATGKVVRFVSHQDGETISLVGLPSGAYVLYLRFPGGEVARRRVILTR